MWDGRCPERTPKCWSQWLRPLWKTMKWKNIQKSVVSQLWGSKCRNLGHFGRQWNETSSHGWYHWCRVLKIKNLHTHYLVYANVLLIKNGVAKKWVLHLFYKIIKCYINVRSFPHPSCHLFPPERVSNEVYLSVKQSRKKRLTISVRVSVIVDRMVCSLHYVPPGSR